MKKTNQSLKSTKLILKKSTIKKLAIKEMQYIHAGIDTLGTSTRGGGTGTG